MERKVIKIKTVTDEKLEGVFIPLSSNATNKMSEILQDSRRIFKEKSKEEGFALNEKYADNIVDAFNKSQRIDVILGSKGIEIEEEAKELILEKDTPDYKDKLAEKSKKIKEERAKKMMEEKDEDIRTKARDALLSGFELSYIFRPTYDFIIHNSLRNPKDLKDKLFKTPEEVGDVLDSKTMDMLISEWGIFNKGKTEEDAKNLPSKAV
jgi:hypothetical protein